MKAGGWGWEKQEEKGENNGVDRERAEKTYKTGCKSVSRVRPQGIIPDVCGEVALT